ncbi:MAG: ParA family protein [Trichlorobacter sp.]|jgi:cellulose biosynthesis protein BcsQ
MMRAMNNFPFILTISSEKGGVGKTTLTTNLAIYLKAMLPDLAVTIISFDNHFTVDKMFELKGQTSKGTVEQLLTGTPASELVLQGQYGVDYIPSSNHLTELYQEFKGPMALCRMMAESGLSGIVLIDTRPDLNILTQNALYAADRVLIPVKDMSSLENCKHIFALFDQRGIDKKSLSLIPCLIDNRIKYDGIFKDQRDLLKGFAINRGYRCLETYISKSPKVESLNTNPDGKIYPILTHARETEVHTQFTELAQDILNSYHHTPEPRACLYHCWLQEQETQKKAAFLARLEGIPAHCVICGRALEGPTGKGFFYESADRNARGFLHSDCFVEMLRGTLYNLPAPNEEVHALSLQMIRESARESMSVFLPQKTPDGDYRLRFIQFDQRGSALLERTVSLTGFTEGRFDGVHDQLYLLLNESLAGDGGGLRNSWLAVHPVDEQRPELVLQEQHYRQLQELHRRVADFLALAGR